MKYIDLTHTFTDNMPVVPGDPTPSLKQITTIEKNGYTDHELKTVMHVGTNIDAPLHMIPGGKYMDEMPVEHFAGTGVVIDVRGKNPIDETVLKGKNIGKRCVIFLCTGMSKKFRTEEYNTLYPEITESFARAIVDMGVKIIGIDMLSPDVDASFPIHKILLPKEVLIIENLVNLEALLTSSSFDVFAFPMKLHAEAAPVRVVARIP